MYSQSTQPAAADALFACSKSYRMCAGVILISLVPNSASIDSSKSSGNSSFRIGCHSMDVIPRKCSYLPSSDSPSPPNSRGRTVDFHVVNLNVRLERATSTSDLSAVPDGKRRAWICTGVRSCHEDLTQPADKKGKKHAAVATASGSGEKKPAEKRPAATDSKAAKGGKKFPVSKPNWPKRVLREVLPPKWKKCVIAAGLLKAKRTKTKVTTRTVRNCAEQNPHRGQVRWQRTMPLYRNRIRHHQLSADDGSRDGEDRGQQHAGVPDPSARQQEPRQEAVLSQIVTRVVTGFRTCGWRVAATPWTKKTRSESSRQCAAFYYRAAWLWETGRQQIKGGERGRKQ
ncbi:ribosomal protein L23a [Culex quinquefasciatus]|uniref:Ribosomal protein L23a n=1 Tax=Culex quinquefasciatus TaxID=7176 RepID=B0XGY6_CULQU|nr:ribosomal protein L23a [Culex quinquefasciatus]|eukprot:XP_001868908.1 ribosomal protein L23a [Culex quinquefasciatus]